MILIGVVFLLETLEIVRLYQIVRYWPVFLILLGCYMLYIRLRGDEPAITPSPRFQMNASAWQIIRAVRGPVCSSRSVV